MAAIVFASLVAKARSRALYRLRIAASSALEAIAKPVSEIDTSVSIRARTGDYGPCPLLKFKFEPPPRYYSQSCRGGGMVDAVVSNTTWETSGGSSPPPGTRFYSGFTPPALLSRQEPQELPEGRPLPHRSSVPLLPRDLDRYRQPGYPQCPWHLAGRGGHR